MFIRSNLAMSLDGKIAARDLRHFYLGSAADRKLMLKLRSECDAVLIGASTLRAFRGPLRAQAGPRQPLNAVVSSRLEGLSPGFPFFRAGASRPLLFAGAATPRSRLRRFESCADTIVLARGKPVAPQIVRALERRGIERLLVEGGGRTMWDFVERDLLDELRVTLTPWLVGGARAPTLVDGRGFAAGRGLKLRLRRARRLGDELYLTYERARPRAR